MVTTLHDVSCEGKRVLLRAELNVPLKEGKVVDDLRIKAVIPTIKVLLSDGASQVVIMAHLGRPKGKVNKALSLKPIVDVLEESLGEKVGFATECIAGKIPKDRVVLLENLRFQKGEEANDKSFAKKLATCGDVYVDDAFGAMHRAHASVDAVPHIFNEKAAGLLVEKELKGLNLSEAERPFIAMIGAAKITDKIEVLSALLEKADKLLLGGAIIFPFLKAKGYEVGSSLCEEESVPLAKELLAKYGDKIVLPVDMVISEDLEGSEIFTVDVDKIPPTMKGLDIGDRTVEKFEDILEGASTVFWNGPLGVFETEPFDHATNKLAKSLAQSKARVVVGGGDTAAAINKLGLAQYYAHVSTGGGAALEYVAGKELPGLKALE
ncbi:phosphoglycerate kinase [Candidatus Woesearchaeota archaeon]|nr:phosphoglycerate kinase [Candidatus Woesearchaeota archaeon]